MSEQALCGLCNLPMPEGEESFNYHGYSGPCPDRPQPTADPKCERCGAFAAMNCSIEGCPNRPPATTEPAESGTCDACGHDADVHRVLNNQRWCAGSPGDTKQGGLACHCEAYVEPEPLDLNPSDWCDQCRSYHPDTTPHVTASLDPEDALEDARAYLATDQRYCAFKSAWDLDEWDKRYAGEMLDVWIPRWMEQYAAKLLAERDKQTVEAFIAEVEKVTGVDKEYDGIAYGVFEAMHAVKERRK